MKRFTEKYIIDDNTGCWNWTASLDAYGYGQFKVEPKNYKAHRFSYENKFGPIPDGLCVLHKCDNRKCVNPSHLFLGTASDNMRDNVSKGRQSKGGLHGRAKLTDETAKWVKDLIKYSSLSNSEISQYFGVSGTAIWLVRKGRTWRHV